MRAEKNWPAVARALRANVDIALTLFRNGSWVAPDREEPDSEHPTS